MTSAAPPINYLDPMLYEHLSLIVGEFEKAALKSGSRIGMMITAQGPLQGMDMVLVSSDKALSMGRTANAKAVNARTASGGSDGTDGDNSDSDWLDHHNDLELVENEPNEELIETDGFGDGILGNATVDINAPSFVVGTTGSVGFDADINALIGPGFGSEDYLSECLGCDLRLTFAWQLQPIDLLGPIAGLLDDINQALDQFEGFLDPFGYLTDLCELLNGLNFFCIPDLMIILGALNMLLQSYLTFQFSLKLDWTVLLGPLLKLILDAIATLLQQIAGILVAPLDCAISALMTVSNLIDELKQTQALASAVGSRVADRVTDTGESGWDDFESTVDPIWKNADAIEPPAGSPFLNEPVTPQHTILETSTSSSKSEESEISIPAGFDFSAQTKLPEAIANPAFAGTNPFKKLALIVQEAKSYIMNLVSKILLAVSSLQGLVSGSLSLSLGNLGLILFVKDMINLVLLIIQMLSQHKGVSDWCSYLEENPAILANELNGTEVVRAKSALNLVVGGEVVGEVKTCFSERTPAQSAMLKQWISDLKRDGET